MRIKVEHRTTYLYDDPPSSIVQILRLTPRSHESQQVHNWRISLDRDALLAPGEDAFGNIIHTLAINRPVDDLTIAVEGEVEMHDAGGVLRGTVERFPSGLYLRETPLTRPDSELRAWTASIARGKETLALLHDLMEGLNKKLTFDTAQKDVTATAAEVFAAGSGVCQDFAHVFIAAARCLGIPARYIGGYMMRTDGVAQGAGHAWAEAHVPGLGWVGFDAANGIAPTETHIRVAVGLDYLGAAPVRGARSGGTAEQLQVSVNVGQTRRQSQS